MADRFRTPRKEKEWNGTGSSIVAMTADGSFLAGGGFNFSASSTIIRMIGEYVITPTSAPTAGDSAIVTIGAGKVSSDAAALGATAMPDPAVEFGYPWLYWASHVFRFAGTSVDGGAAGASLRHRFDIRSMRKFKPNESLAIVVQYSNNAGDPPLTLNLPSWRLLLALS